MKKNVINKKKFIYCNSNLIKNTLKFLFKTLNKAENKKNLIKLILLSKKSENWFKLFFNNNKIKVNLEKKITLKKINFLLKKKNKLLYQTLTTFWKSRYFYKKLISKIKKKKIQILLKKKKI